MSRGSRQQNRILALGNISSRLEFSMSQSNDLAPTLQLKRGEGNPWTQFVGSLGNLVESLNQAEGVLTQQEQEKVLSASQKPEFFQSIRYASSLRTDPINTVSLDLEIINALGLNTDPSQRQTSTRGGFFRFRRSGRQQSGRVDHLKDLGLESLLELSILAQRVYDHIRTEANTRRTEDIVNLAANIEAISDMITNRIEAIESYNSGSRSKPQLSNSDRKFIRRGSNQPEQLLGSTLALIKDKSARMRTYIQGRQNEQPNYRRLDTRPSGNDAGDSDSDGPQYEDPDATPQLAEMRRRARQSGAAPAPDANYAAAPPRPQVPAPDPTYAPAPPSLPGADADPTYAPAPTPPPPPPQAPAPDPTYAPAPPTLPGADADPTYAAATPPPQAPAPDPTYASPSTNPSSSSSSSSSDSSDEDSSDNSDWEEETENQDLAKMVFGQLQNGNITSDKLLDLDFNQTLGEEEEYGIFQDILLEENEIKDLVILTHDDTTAQGLQIISYQSAADDDKRRLAIIMTSDQNPQQRCFCDFTIDNETQEVEDYSYYVSDTSTGEATQIDKESSPLPQRLAEAIMRSRVLAREFGIITHENATTAQNENVITVQSHVRAAIDVKRAVQTIFTKINQQEVDVKQGILNRLHLDENENGYYKIEEDILVRFNNETGKIANIYLQQGYKSYNIVLDDLGQIVEVTETDLSTSIFSEDFLNSSKLSVAQSRPIFSRLISSGALGKLQGVFPNQEERREHSEDRYAEEYEEYEADTEDDHDYEEDQEEEITTLDRFTRSILAITPDHVRRLNGFDEQGESVELELGDDKYITLALRQDSVVAVTLDLGSRLYRIVADQDSRSITRARFIPDNPEAAEGILEGDNEQHLLRVLRALESEPQLAHIISSSRRAPTESAATLPRRPRRPRQEGRRAAVPNRYGTQDRPLELETIYENDVPDIASPVNPVGGGQRPEPSAFTDLRDNLGAGGMAPPVMLDGEAPAFSDPGMGGRAGPTNPALGGGERPEPSAFTDLRASLGDGGMAPPAMSHDGAPAFLDPGIGGGNIPLQPTYMNPGDTGARDFGRRDLGPASAGHPAIAAAGLGAGARGVGTSTWSGDHDDLSYIKTGTDIGPSHINHASLKGKLQREYKQKYTISESGQVVLAADQSSPKGKILITADNSELLQIGVVDRSDPNWEKKHKMANAYSQFGGLLISGVSIPGDASLFMSSFRGCIFHEVDFSQIPPEIFNTINFHNCVFKDVLLPEGIEKGASNWDGANIEGSSERQAEDLGILKRAAAIKGMDVDHTYSKRQGPDAHQSLKKSNNTYDDQLREDLSQSYEGQVTRGSGVRSSTDRLSGGKSMTYSGRHPGYSPEDPIGQRLQRNIIVDRSERG